jgi:ribosomal protein S18 acetylase RimI-like enzyme
VLVARDDSGVLGAAVVLRHAKRRHARLYSIAVAEKARGRGVGSALLDAAEAAARARGAEGMRLEVRADDAATRRLYETRGYRRLSDAPAYYEDGAAAARYESPLA